jgi:adenine/guanine phosphoribosyltransferase-like PRPP-binding protein
MAKEIVQKSFNIESLPRFSPHEGLKIPYIQRVIIHRPPSLKLENELPHGELCRSDDRLRIIDSTPNTLTPGGRNLLKGLLENGGAAQFGSIKDPDMGLDYENVYKKIYNPEVSSDALTELADVMQKDARERGLHIDGILAPEQSGVLLGGIISNLFEDKPMCVPVQKNGKAKSPVAVAVDSYSKGQVDVMSLPLNILDIMKKKNGDREINLVLFDDILDTGTMTKAMAVLLQMARERGYKVNLIGIIAPIEKGYTHAREIIAEEVGDMPVYSTLSVEDMGVYQGMEPWMKIDGVQTPFACGMKSFCIPAKTEKDEDEETWSI